MRFERFIAVSAGIAVTFFLVVLIIMVLEQMS